MLPVSNISASLKLILKSIIPTVVILVLSILVWNFAYSKIGDLNSELAKSKNDETVLSGKVELLKNISSFVAGQTNIAAVALPPTNPALTVLSQIRVSASNSGINVSNVKAGSEVLDKSGLSRVDISFDLQGTRNSVIAYLRTINSYLPITLLSKVKMSDTQGITVANVTVSSYFSAFPKQLSAINQTTSDLSANDRALLIQLNQMHPPIFGDIPAVLNGQMRSDPFSNK